MNYVLFIKNNFRSVIQNIKMANIRFLYNNCVTKILDVKILNFLFNKQFANSINQDTCFN